MPAVPERVPAGRAGRLWLIDRLAAAQRGAELLDRKRQLLRRDRDRLRLLAERRRSELEAAFADAEQWALRAALLGGAAELALVARSVADRAEVTVTWQNTMGAVHPGDARCRLPVLAPIDGAASNAALAPTAAAYRRVLDLAAGVAVAESARDLVAAELAATQRRLRAIAHHRVPALGAALQQLEQQLDEHEREDRVIERWARRRRGGGER
ncbi:MAG: V-type ATP synthase subunit D [Candidatus Lustribacter sp.]